MQHRYSTRSAQTLQNEWLLFCCPFYCSLTLHKVPFISLVTQDIFFDVAVAAPLSTQKVPFIALVTQYKFTSLSGCSANPVVMFSDPSYLVNTSKPIHCPMNVVSTKRHIVRRYPMPHILPSLSSNFSNLHRFTKVNFDPLIVILVFCAPRPNVSPGLNSSKSPKPRGMETVVRWWGGDLVIAYTTISHTQRAVTKGR